MASQAELMIAIRGELKIFGSKNYKSTAIASKKYFVFPENVGDLKVEDENLFFAGGND